jgi:hypothetical protein
MRSRVLSHFAVHALLAAASGACKPKGGSANVKAVVGTDDDGRKAAFAIVPVYNYGKYDAHPSAVGNDVVARAEEIRVSPFFGVVECKAASADTPFSQVEAAISGIETMARDGNLFVDKDRELAAFSDKAQLTKLGCHLLGSRLVSAAHFIDAFARVAAIPPILPNQDQRMIESSAASYILGQSLYLAFRGPTYKNSPAADPFKMGLLDKALFQFATMPGVSPTGGKNGINGILPFADERFNPCNKANGSVESFWYVSSWKQRNYSCVEDSSDSRRFNYRPGGQNGENYGKIVRMLVREVAATHADLFSGQQSKDAIWFDVLTTLKPASMLAPAERPIAAYVAGENPGFDIAGFFGKGTGAGLFLGGRNGGMRANPQSWGDVSRFYQNNQGQIQSRPPTIYDTRASDQWNYNGIQQGTGGAQSANFSNAQGENVFVNNKATVDQAKAAGYVPPDRNMSATAWFKSDDQFKNNTFGDAGRGKDVFYDATIPSSSSFQQGQTTGGRDVVMGFRNADGTFSGASAPALDRNQTGGWLAADPSKDANVQTAFQNSANSYFTGYLDQRGNAQNALATGNSSDSNWTKLNSAMSAMQSTNKQEAFQTGGQKLDADVAANARDAGLRNAASADLRDWDQYAAQTNAQKQQVGRLGADALNGLYGSARDDVVGRFNNYTGGLFSKKPEASGGGATSVAEASAGGGASASASTESSAGGATGAAASAGEGKGGNTNPWTNGGVIVGENKGGSSNPWRNGGTIVSESKPGPSEGTAAAESKGGPIEPGTSKPSPTDGSGGSAKPNPSAAEEAPMPREVPTTTVAPSGYQGDEGAAYREYQDSQTTQPSETSN